MGHTDIEYYNQNRIASPLNIIILKSHSYTHIHMHTIAYLAASDLNKNKHWIL